MTARDILWVLFDYAKRESRHSDKNQERRNKPQERIRNQPNIGILVPIDEFRKCFKAEQNKQIYGEKVNTRPANLPSNLTLPTK